MKKSLFALAALGAFATAAQAQSSVTLFGTLDASTTYISNGGVTGSTTAPGAATAATGTSATDPALRGIAAGNELAYYDSQIASSQWGMRGTEDLGGGMTANFYLAGDANTNSGGSNNAGIFRRGAWVGVSGGFGEVRLGTQSNPIVSASGSLLPVMGNTVNGYRNGIAFAAGDFNRNAIGYITPTVGGAGLELQYALNNTIDAGYTDGTVMNARAFYNAGALDFTAAYQKRSSMSATGIGAAGASAAATAPIAANTDLTSTYTSANPGGEVIGYLAGIKYKVTKELQLGLGWAHGEGDNTQYRAGQTSTAVTNLSTLSTYRGNATLVGVGYQLTPAMLLGANYIVNTADSNMSNVQARYSLSKRTMLYFQGTMVVNGSGANAQGAAYGNMIALGGQTSKSPAIQVGGWSTTGLPNTTTSAYGVGVIHNF